SARPAAEGCPGSQEECTLQVSRRLVALGAASAIMISACSNTGATSAPATQAPASQPPASVAAPSAEAPSEATSAAPSEALNTNWKACVAFDTGGLGDK